MVMDKLRSLHRALLYSYQACWVRRDNDPRATWQRALMNPDKVKFDYDEKILSIDYESEFHAGDTFEWGKGTGSHWIILKPEDTEIAYLRANCRRCHYLTATDPETHEEFSQWAAIRGPVETKLNTIQKAGIIADVPNLTLDIYICDNEQNRRTFERYHKFEFNGRTWMVNAPDFISTPGILEIQVQEDYECDHLDFELKEDPNPPVEAEDNEIMGETFVKPLENMMFSPKFAIAGAEWSISLPATKNKEIDDVLDYKIAGDNIRVKWTAMKSGSYILHYGDLEKTVIVESLF